MSLRRQNTFPKKAPHFSYPIIFVYDSTKSLLCLEKLAYQKETVGLESDCWEKEKGKKSTERRTKIKRDIMRSKWKELVKLHEIWEKWKSKKRGGVKEKQKQ